jgi:hypothetical protein
MTTWMYRLLRDRLGWLVLLIAGSHSYFFLNPSGTATVTFRAGGRTSGVAEIRDSAGVPPTDASGNPNEPVRRISISDSGTVVKGSPPDVAVPSTAPPAPPPTSAPPPNFAPPPHVEIPEPDIQINIPE